MATYDDVREELASRPERWVVTGAAGFIGSNLVEALLALGQDVVGLDNFATGHRRNLEDAVRDAVASAGPSAGDRFRFLEADITDPDACRELCEGAAYVLHQAALGSVPRSLDDPVSTHRANVDGFVQMLVAARDAGVRRFVYASSSSVYGDHPTLPKVEEEIGAPLSPYAASKRIGELYADVFARSYGLESIGLRYFNVFGRRQDPDGPYAAVIPKWVGRLLEGLPCQIFGDGETSRDFCYIDNVIQANLLAATADGTQGGVYNIACGERTTLLELHDMIRSGLAPHRPDIADLAPAFENFRPGDVRHSLADISKAERDLGYRPTHGAAEGLARALDWYVEHLARVD